jgi:hypothetical protein
MLLCELATLAGAIVDVWQHGFVPKGPLQRVRFVLPTIT